MFRPFWPAAAEAERQSREFRFRHGARRLLAVFNLTNKREKLTLLET